MAHTFKLALATEMYSAAILDYVAYPLSSLAILMQDVVDHLCHRAS